jgi:hypothetical protein
MVTEASDNTPALPMSEEHIWEEVNKLSPDHKCIVSLVLLALKSGKSFNLSSIALELHISLVTAYERLENALVELGKSLKQRTTDFNILDSSEYRLIQEFKQKEFKRQLRLKEMKELADAGAPVGAPSPMPVPPEVIEEELRTFNESEILEAIEEIRSGRGLTFEEFMEKLDSPDYLNKESTSH